MDSVFGTKDYSKAIHAVVVRLGLHFQLCLCEVKPCVQGPCVHRGGSISDLLQTWKLQFRILYGQRSIQHLFQAALDSLGLMHTVNRHERSRAASFIMAVCRVGPTIRLVGEERLHLHGCKINSIVFWQSSMAPSSNNSTSLLGARRAANLSCMRHPR